MGRDYDFVPKTETVLRTCRQNERYRAVLSLMGATRREFDTHGRARGGIEYF